MSFVVDHVRRIDSQLDRLQLTSSLSTANINTVSTPEHPIPSPRVLALQSLIKSLSPAATSRNPLLPPETVNYYLSQSASLEASALVADADPKDEYEHELEWSSVSKCTTQVYGIVSQKSLDDTVASASDIWYWDDVSSSRRYTASYSSQTSPSRSWGWGSAVWDDVKRRGGHFDLSVEGVRGVGENAQASLGQRWRQFYGSIREVVRERGVKEMQKRVVGPVARVRSEVRVKQNKSKRMRVRGANALGVLLGEGMVNESIHGEGLATPSEQSGPHKWKASVARNVALVEAVSGRVHEEGLGVDKFDSAIAESTDEDPLYEVEFWSEGDKTRCSVQPAQVAERLHQLLTVRSPAYNASSTALVQQHGRPSRSVRYWLPLTVGILSSSTILRILVNRKAEIIQWITELGATIVDFWANWVVEPTRKVIATIRHDEGSEVSIMSRKSLEGDRASLERMVVDFAVANPETSTGTTAPLTEPQIAEIRTAVREGDLTPVSRAYEKDLASPLMGTVRGNSIRALSIQIQKTKVDVEVAMGGIDALLKSQELVFGFVGSTPGILVTSSLYRWLGASMSRKSGEKKGRDRGVMIRQSRNIDRVSANARPTEFGESFYRDQGSSLCEVHVLGREAARSMPDQVRREFAEEVEELVDVRSGVERQRRVVERIRWAYGRWF